MFRAQLLVPCLHSVDTLTVAAITKSTCSSSFFIKQPPVGKGKDKWRYWWCHAMGHRGLKVSTDGGEKINRTPRRNGNMLYHWGPQRWIPSDWLTWDYQFLELHKWTTCCRLLYLPPQQMPRVNGENASFQLAFYYVSAVFISYIFTQFKKMTSFKISKQIKQPRFYVLFILVKERSIPVHELPNPFHHF